MAGAFSRKASGISCDLTAFRKIKELCANAVETPLGVTGLLHEVIKVEIGGWYKNEYEWRKRKAMEDIHITLQWVAMNRGTFGPSSQGSMTLLKVVCKLSKTNYIN